MPNETTMFELFKMWAGGELLVSKTKDYHALQAIERFENFVSKMTAEQINKLKRIDE